jgi:hypothetical protein
MTEQRLTEYRGLVGLQVQYGQQGDSHKVMEMQLLLEKTISEWLRLDIISALQEMNAHPLKDISCNMTRDEISAYRMIQGDGMRFFSDDGFEGLRGFDAWKVYQVNRAELFVDGLIEQRVLYAVRPFLTMRVN